MDETGRRFEIEVSPAMIEAGMAAVDGYDRADGLIGPGEEVCLIYRAMEAARLSRMRHSHPNS